MLRPSVRCVRSHHADRRADDRSDREKEPDSDDADRRSQLDGDQRHHAEPVIAAKAAKEVPRQMAVKSDDTCVLDFDGYGYYGWRRCR
jgi:hypothetical protein